MSFRLRSEGKMPDALLPEAGLLCPEEHLRTTIERAVASALVLDTKLDKLFYNLGFKLLIVAESRLDVLCEAVGRVRRSGYAGALLAASLDADPPAIERVVAAGADDYVSLPDRAAELPYRALALLRHKSGFWGRNAGERSRSEVQLDPNLRTALVEGQPVILTLIEFLILQYLQARPAIWVSTSELLSEVCGCPPQTDSTRVRVHMASLRKKLGARRDLVESRRTYGYRWIESPDEKPIRFTQS